MNIPRMQKLTKDLIAIDSVTGNESEIIDFLCRELSQRNYLVQTFEVEGTRRNILATFEVAPPRILFNTHLDTVPVQYGPFEDENKIYGRGACDTHGILAAQLEALEVLQKLGVSGLGLLLVVGEETTHDGAIQAGKEVPAPEFLIVGEPTENKLMSFQKGRLKADLTVFGVEGHSGYPEKFESSLQKMNFFLSEIWSTDWLAHRSENGTTVNVTMQNTPTFDNQVPALTKVRLMFRCAESCKEVQRKLEKTLSEAEQKLYSSLSGKNYDLQWLQGSSEPVTNLQALPGFATGVASYNTDIQYFGWSDSKTFLVGPGSILQAHRDLRNGDWQPGEWIDKNEQIAGVELYKALVSELI